MTSHSLTLPQDADFLDTPPRPAPSDCRRTIWAGAAIVALTFGLFGGWAATAPLDSAVVAHGQLGVQSKRKTVQHLEGGIVKEILAHDGDQVAAGQVLLRLDDSKAVSTLELTRDQYDAARGELARLEAERDSLPAIAFPADLQARHDAKTRAMLAAQQQQFDERRKSLEAQISVLAQREAQLSSEIDGYRIQQGADNRQIALSHRELSGLRELADKGYYPKNHLLQMERDIAKLEGDRGSAESSEARSRKSISETRMQALQTRQQFRESVAKDLDQALHKVTDLRDQLTTAEDTVRRLEVLAPVSGQVQNSRLATPGGVITAASELMDIVPVEDRLVVEAEVSPNDIEAVQANDRAELRFTALRGRTTPVLTGKVETVSADHLTNQRTGNPYYAVRVEVSKEELARLDGRHITAGMPVEVMIKGGERTALDYMIKPMADSFASAFKER